MDMLRMGLIGCGQWGPNLARTFDSSPRSRLVSACDVDEGNLSRLASRFKGLGATTDYHDVVKDDRVDAVIIATPATAHYEVVKAALRAGKHVFVEKPLTERLDTSRELTALAREQDRILMVGYVFLFNSAIRWIKTFLDQGDLGRATYLHAMRTNLGPVRDDVNVVWDLMAHDISVYLYWMGCAPARASATGGRYTGMAREDVAVTSLTFPEGQLGIIHASWLDPCKVRRIIVVGESRMLLFDDMAPSEPVRIYDKGVAPTDYVDSLGAHRMAVRSGDITIPNIRMSEPLAAECDAFVRAVLDGETNPGIGSLPLVVAAVMEAMDASLRNEGAPAHVQGP